MAGVELWTNLPDVDTTTVRRLKRDEYDRLVELGAFGDERLEQFEG